MSSGNASSGQHDEAPHRLYSGKRSQNAANPPGASSLRRSRSRLVRISTVGRLVLMVPTVVANRSDSEHRQKGHLWRLQRATRYDARTDTARADLSTG